MATARKHDTKIFLIEIIPIYRSCLCARVVSGRSFQFRLSVEKMCQESRNTSLRKTCMNTRH